MTTEAMRLANARNSKRSTGPRSRRGKAASSRNALRYGLAVPVSALPDSNEEVTALLQQIVEPHAAPEARIHARAFAEATVELWRIAGLKALIISSGMEDSDRFHMLALEGEAIDFLEPFRSTVEELRRVGRYERRALSRRNGAFKEMVRISKPR
jgi:hypothetical protein